MRKTLFGIILLLLIVLGGLITLKNPQIFQANSLNVAHTSIVPTATPLPSLGLTSETDLSQIQTGSSFWIKLRYTNSTETGIAKSQLVTTINDSFGTTLDRFSNNSLIKPNGGNIYNSISVPNIPGAIYYIQCHANQLSCNPLRIVLPGEHTQKLDLLENSQLVDSDTLTDSPNPIIETPFQKSPVDFELIAITHEPYEHKYKITLDYRQNTYDSFTGELQYQYQSTDERVDTSFITTIPEKTYQKGENARTSFYITNLSDFEITLDPNEKTADPYRLNNSKIFSEKLHLDKNDDIAVTHVDSKITENEGKKMIKVYVEYKNAGINPVDSTEFTLSANLPYLNTEYHYDSIGSSTLNSGDIGSFTTYLPLQSQNQPMNITLQYENDRNTENNTTTLTLDGLTDETYTDISVSNAAAKIVDNAIKLYIEYSQKSDQSITAPITLSIADFETKTLLFSREISFDSGYPFEANTLYSYEELLPYSDWTGKTLVITLDADNRFNDPIPLNNSTLLILP